VPKADVMVESESEHNGSGSGAGQSGEADKKLGKKNLLNATPKR